MRIRLAALLADEIIYNVGVSIARPGGIIFRFRIGLGETGSVFCADGQHPRVASLALRAIHLLAAPTFFQGDNL